jgi:hypothetical protein
MTQFTDDLVEACKTEYQRWDNGAGRETWGRPQHSKDYYLFVKEYWVSIGNNNLTGRTVVNGVRPAWSSAFVSFCEKRAGAGDKFRYTEAHCHYINKAMLKASNPSNNFGYAARRPESYKPKVGDIICGGREYAAGYDYDQAALIYEADSFYPSHGDIVVEMTSSRAITIGGNITNNVDMKRLRLTDTGYLRNRINSSGRELPWVAILECLM